MTGDHTPEEVKHLLNNCENFGKVFKSIRKSRKLNQCELGQILGCDKSTISRWERGNLPHDFQLEDVHKIGLFLKCSPQELARLVASFICYLLSKGGF